MLEDIIEDLERARSGATTGNHIEFTKILIDKVFGGEPENLKATLTQRTEMPECDEEEKKSNTEFISKIKPCFFKDFSDKIEMTAEANCVTETMD